MEEKINNMFSLKKMNAGAMIAYDKSEPVDFTVNVIIAAALVNFFPVKYINV